MLVSQETAQLLEFCISEDGKVIIIVDVKLEDMHHVDSMSN